MTMSSDWELLQKSFDDAVLENMQTFEMQRDEAAQDAVQQFKAQGINTQLIVTDGSTEQLRERAEQLRRQLQQLQLSELLAECRWMSQYCNVSVAHRCAAARCQVYQHLLELAERILSGHNDLQVTPSGADNSNYSDIDKSNASEAAVTAGCVLAACVTSLAALMHGQPDLLEAHGASLLVALLNKHNHSSEDDVSLTQPASANAAAKNENLLAPTLDWLTACTRLHEANRQLLAGAGVLQLLCGLLRQLSAEQQVEEGGRQKLLASVCVAAGNFTADDDVRVEFGNAHANAKCLVELGAVHALKAYLLRDGARTSAEVENVVGLVSKLCVSADICESLAADGGLAGIVTTLDQHRSHPGVCGRCLSLLANLAGSDKLRVDIISAGCAPVIVSIMHSMKKHSAVCLAGLRALSFLALRAADNAVALAEAGAVQLLADLMRLHVQHTSMQKLACMAVRNMVSRSRQLCEPFLSADMESLVNAALKNHKEVEFEARAALRDLNCAVELRECWTGHGGALTTGFVVPRDPDQHVSAAH